MKGKVRTGALVAILRSGYFCYKFHPPFKSANEFSSRASVNAGMFDNQPRRMLRLLGFPKTRVFSKRVRIPSLSPPMGYAS